MARHTRYQGAILRGDEILLIAHRSHGSGRLYWLLPGGGIEAGESEEECVRREMQEETSLDVQVERLLLDEDAKPGSVYQRIKTYLCVILAGEPSPGYEPEEEASAVYAIVEVRWLDLRDPLAWDSAVRSDPWTSSQLLDIREALGYPPANL